MANFTTHIAVGTVVSGGLATLTLAADVMAPEDLVAITLAGVLGSVLPDIDLKDSRPSRALFSGLAIFLSFCALFTVADRYSIAEMWLLWLGTFVLVRFGAEAAFHRFSAHRGIWHSILAGLLFCFLTAIVFEQALGKPEGIAWLAGCFLLAGYLTHLVLDEIYSVDVMDTRVKASFGSALKLYDPRSLGDSVIVAAAAVALFAVTPSPQPLLDGLASRQLWAGLHKRLLPQDKWFGLIGPDRGVAGGRGSTPLETGSIALPADSGEASTGTAAEAPPR